MSHPAPLNTDDGPSSTDSSPPNSPGAVFIPPHSPPSTPINTQPQPRPWGAWAQQDWRTETFIRGPTYERTAAHACQHCQHLQQPHSPPARTNSSCSYRAAVLLCACVCSYLSSKHKIVARQPWMHCHELEVLTSKQRLDNIAGRPNSPLDRLNTEAAVTVPAGLTALDPFHPSFTLVLTWAVPLKDSDGVYVVIYLRHNKANLPHMADPRATMAARQHGAAIDEKKVSVNQNGEYTDPVLETAARSAFLIALDRFVKSSNEYRDNHFKFIPRLIEGNFIVKKAIGSKPALIGTKLKQSYHMNLQKNYLEIDVDVCSSKIAANIFGLVKKVAKELTIDFNFTIEGQDMDTLPEVLIGGGRIIHIDTSKAGRP